MTRRERNLWLLVGLTLVLATIYYIWDNRRPALVNNLTKPAGAVGPVTLNLSEAYRLLRAENNIRNRRKAVATLRNEAESHFLAARDPEASQLALLKMIEKLGAQAGLSVDQKNLTSLNDNYIAVTLEGKTSPASLTRFLESVSDENAAVNLEIHRLQIHALPEQRMLNYQLVVAALLIVKKGRSNSG